MSQTVIRYYRKGRVPRGCVVGMVDGGGISIGWSLYHKNLEKKVGKVFTKKRARLIATNRIFCTKTIKNDIPQSLARTAEKVWESCEKIIQGDDDNGRNENGTSVDQG